MMMRRVDDLGKPSPCDSCPKICTPSTQSSARTRQCCPIYVDDHPCYARYIFIRRLRFSTLSHG